MGGELRGGEATVSGARRMVPHPGAVVRRLAHAPSAALLALLLTVAVTAAACGDGGVGPRAPSGGAPGEVTAPVPAAGHAGLDAIATLAELPRVTVRLTRGASEVVEVLAAVAADDASRTRGLQGVTDLPDGVGMLFLFPEPAGPGGRPGFWMRDTLVPLDIVFATLEASDGAATVVGVASMVPCVAMPCPITHPGVDYDLALEVVAGWLDATGVSPGDGLTWAPAVRPG